MAEVAALGGYTTLRANSRLSDREAMRLLAFCQGLLHGPDALPASLLRLAEVVAGAVEDLRRAHALSTRTAVQTHAICQGILLRQQLTPITAATSTTATTTPAALPSAIGARPDGAGTTTATTPTPPPRHPPCRLWWPGTSAPESRCQSAPDPHRYCETSMEAAEPVRKQRKNPRKPAEPPRK